MRLRDFFSSPVATGSGVQPQNLTAWGDWGTTTDTWAGTTVTTKNATQLLMVYGCVRFIADGISTLPVDVLRKRADGTAEDVDRRPVWLSHPTADLDYIEWAGQMLSSLLLAGNAYCLKTYSGSALSQLTPIDPSQVQPQVDGSYLINGLRFTSFEILHIRGWMYPGSRVGMSPVEAARQAVGVGMAAQEYAARFFSDDSTPTGVIEVPSELDAGQAKQWAQSWARAHSGQKNRKLPGVLSGGAKWTQTAITNEQAQFLESRKYTAAEICSQMFLIDPTEMGIGIEGQSLTYANLVERKTYTVQKSFMPWIIRIEKALTDLLPRPQYVKLNTNAFLRGDTKNRFDAYAVGINNGFMTPNEARAFENWGPIPGGDEVP